MTTGELAVRVLAKVAPHRGMEAFWSRQRATDPAMRLVDAIVRRGDVVADVGASFGLYTSRLARIVGSVGRVHAFEPNPANIGWLKRVRAGRDWVVIHPMALSDEVGEAELHVPVVEGEERREEASLNPPRGRFARTEDVSVNVTCLDAVLEGDPPKFVKCDVEGHEQSFLRGARETLRHHHPVLLIEIEERHREEPVATTIEHLVGEGYDAYAVTPSGLRPGRDFDAHRHQLEPLARCDGGGVPVDYVNNFLFLPRGAEPPVLT